MNLSHKIDRWGLIPFDEKYIFTFIEHQNRSECPEHPISGVFLNTHDLSINVRICIKWMNWGVFFFKNLSEEISMPDCYDYVKAPIQKNIDWGIREPHVFLLNDSVINSDIDVLKILGDLPVNFPVLVTLRVNLDEYVRIGGHLWPTLMRVVGRYDSKTRTWSDY